MSTKNTVKKNINLNNIIILGDSIYRGTIYDYENKRYTTSSEYYLSELGNRLSIAYKNKSAFGLNTKRVITKNIHIEAIDSCEQKPEIFLLILGGNDCNYDWQKVGNNPKVEHLPEVTPEEYVTNITQIINDVKKRNIKPVIVSLTPLHAQKYFAYISTIGNSEGILEWLGTIQTLYMWHEYYNNLLQQTAAKLSVRFVNIRNYFLQSHNFNDLFSEDGIHLSANGYQLLTESIEKEFYNDPVL